MNHTTFWVCLCLACYSPIAVRAKIYQRCELAKELVEKHKISKTFVSNWICLIEHESFMNTTKITEMPDGSAKYGLFQISSKTYCSKGRKGGVCNKKCSDFLDNNISDDVKCANFIFESEGFKHWKGWNTYCKNSANVPPLNILC